jgi:ribonucleoside-diphosphate reductase alpha chain
LAKNHRKRRSHWSFNDGYWFRSSFGYEYEVSCAKVVKEENERVASIIGINKAARTTTVKPAGTTSLTLGTSSGIHAWHNDYYIRRIRVGKNESMYSTLGSESP